MFLRGFFNVFGTLPEGRALSIRPRDRSSSMSIVRNRERFRCTDSPSSIDGLSLFGAEAGGGFGASSSYTTGPPPTPAFTPRPPRVGQERGVNLRGTWNIGPDDGLGAFGRTEGRFVPLIQPRTVPRRPQKHPAPRPLAKKRNTPDSAQKIAPVSLPEASGARPTYHTLIRPQTAPQRRKMPPHALVGQRAQDLEQKSS